MKLRPSVLVKNFDWVSAIAMIILLATSLIMLYSIALGSDDPSDLLNFQKQIVFVLVGLALYVGIAFFLDYRMLARLARPLLVVGVLLLVAVLVFGSTVRGTTGWFVLGPFSLQPVELVKIIEVVVLAAFFAAKAKYIKQLKYLIASALGVALLVGLILLQPDFGSAVILGAVWLGLILVTGIRKAHLLAMMAGFAATLSVLWFAVFEEYQKNRIRVFLEPELDPLGTGYNVTQAIIAVGSGQLFGRGLSFGSQSKLKFLPEAQTDFIFAVIAEQLGFVGVVVLISLFGVLLWRMLVIARQAADNFASYLVLGALFVIFTQMIINVSMNLGLLPVTGLTLPLVSYGGSSLVATMMLLGIVQSVAMRGRSVR